MIIQPTLLQDYVNYGIIVKHLADLGKPSSLKFGAYTLTQNVNIFLGGVVKK